MIVYIAGPMRGHDFHNFPAFHDTADSLAMLGHFPFDPAQRDLDEGFDPAHTIEEQSFDLAAALRCDLAFIVTVADGVVVLDGWETSRGASLEVEVARACGKPIFTLTGDNLIPINLGEW